MKRQKAGVGVWLGVVGLWLLAGCATGAASGEGEDVWARGRDAYQQLQEASGLEETARHPAGAALYVEQARQLLGHLARTPLTYGNSAPRQALLWLLEGVLEGGERVEYADLRWRAQRFWRVVQVRPDGYVVAAHDGTPLQRQGPLRLEEGVWKVGGMDVGSFYFSQGGVFFPVTEALRRADGSPLGELGLERDPLNAALDGAQDALVEMAVALGQCVLHPIRSTEDLALLPHTLARLIATSPEYFARYRVMSQQDQIREAARLSTHLVMLLRGGHAAAGRIGGLGAELPVVSLGARGELVMGRAVVATSTMTATLALDPSALSVLHMANRGQGGGSGGSGAGAPPQTRATPGPGRWTYKTPTTESVRARDYQEQVTGRPAWWVYLVGEVEFDGFNGKALLEAKGVGYKHFLTKSGTAQPWFQNSKGFIGLMQQAENQSKLARTLNLPVIWHVAEMEFAHFLRQFFTGKGWTNIEVRYTPPT